jgi:MFS family permease
MDRFITSASRTNYSLAAAYRMLGVLVLAYIVAFLDRQIIALLVAPIQVSLKLSDFQIALLQGPAFSLAFCIATLPVGVIVSRWSRRNVLICGVSFWSIGTVFCGLVDSFHMLFAARMIVGLGEATLAPAAYTLIVDAFPRERIIRALSIFTMAGILGGRHGFCRGQRRDRFRQ